MRSSNAKPAGRCDRGAQGHSPVTASPTETGSEMGAPRVGEPDQSPVPSSDAKSRQSGVTAVGAEGRRRPELRAQRDQRAGQSAPGQSHSVVLGDHAERRVRKRMAVGGMGERGSKRRYNLRTGRRESAGMREERFQKEFSAETETEEPGRSSSEVPSSADGPGGQNRHPGTEGDTTALFIAGEQAGPSEEPAVQGSARRPQSLAAGGTGSGRDTEIRVDDGAGVPGCPELRGTSHQSRERGGGSESSPRDVRKDERGLEMSEPGEVAEHGGEQETGKAEQHAGASWAKAAAGDSSPPVTFPSRTEPEVAADDDATSRALPRPEQSPAELRHCQPEPSVADIHDDSWVLRIPETADEMGSSGFPFASVLPPTGEDQPLTWSHQLIQNLSTEPSRPQTHPASAVPDPSDVGVPPSVFQSDSQMTSLALGGLQREQAVGKQEDATHLLCGLQREQAANKQEDATHLLCGLQREQAAGKQEDATHLLCGLVTELSTLNRMVMAAHRELESLRRGRSPRPPLRWPYCPRRLEP